MINILGIELSALLLAALTTFVCTIPTIWIARKTSLVTDKRSRKHPAHTHQGIIPRAGGLPILLGVLIGTISFIAPTYIMLGVLISSLLLVLIGLADDYGDISPYKRFFFNIVVATIAIGFGLGIPYISNPLGGVIRLDQWQFTIDFFGPHTFLVISNLLAIGWLVWTTNMVNWSKGVDGQLPGFVAITAICLGLLAKRFTAHDISAQEVGVFSFIVAGAYLGFLPWNFYPQKIMPGYGGGGLAGFLLGILSILSFGKIGTAILILAIPTIDAVYTIVRRLKNKQSPFRADWGHFHHRLLEAGWGRRRVAVFYWIISAILGAASLFFEGVEKLVAFLATGLVLLAFILILNQVKTTHLKK